MVISGCLAHFVYSSKASAFFFFFLFLFAIINPRTHPPARASHCGRPRGPSDVPKQLINTLPFTPPFTRHHRRKTGGEEKKREKKKLIQFQSHLTFQSRHGHFVHKQSGIGMARFANGAGRKCMLGRGED